jgi:hypothetical protein
MFKPDDRVVVHCFPDAWGYKKGDYLGNTSIPQFYNAFTPPMWDIVKLGDIFTVVSMGEEGVRFKEVEFAWPNQMFRLAGPSKKAGYACVSLSENGMLIGEIRNSIIEAKDDLEDAIEDTMSFDDAISREEAFTILGKPKVWKIEMTSVE